MQVGVIGYGNWGENLVRNISQNKHLKIKYVCDSNPQRLKLLKKHYPSQQTTLFADEVFADPVVSAVVIAVNPNNHFPLVHEALSKNKHVLVEKPLTTSAAKAYELQKIALQNKLCLMVDLTFLYNGATRKINEIIKSGTLGNILYIDSNRVNYSTFQKDVNVLWDLAFHDLSIFNFFLDQLPSSVSAMGSSHYHKNIENIANLNLRYPKGTFCNIHCTWPSPIKIRQMRICGNKKTLIYDDQLSSNKIQIYNSGYHIVDKEQQEALDLHKTQTPEMPEYDTSEALKLVIEDFYNSIINNKKPIASIDYAIEIIKILETAQYSINENGKEISI